MTYLKSRRFIGAAFTAITMLSMSQGKDGNAVLTSTVTIPLTSVFSSPLASAGLSGIWAALAGVIYVFLEGMLIFATFGPVW